MGHKIDAVVIAAKETDEPPQQFEWVENENHEMNWIRAIKGEATSPFECAAPLTETMLLGLVSLRANQQKLRWDAEAGTVTNVVTARDLMHVRLGVASAGGVAHFEADEALSEVNA